MFTKNGNILKVNGNWLNPHVEPDPPEPPGPSFDEVTIGTQTWLAKNLAIDDGQGGITIVDNVTANGVNFGTQYYYTWDAAIRVANSIEGWHLPTDNEWLRLASAIGGTSVAGTKLKSTTGWDNSSNGDDSYGFTGLPVGGLYSGEVILGGSYAFFWTANEYQSSRATDRYLSTDTEMHYDRDYKSNGYSIRLIKDT